MPDPRWERIKELFNAALALPADQRAGFLDRECAADADLRREIDSLLTARTLDALRSDALGPGDLLMGGGGIPPVLSADDSTVLGRPIPLTEKPGDVIGPYKLREQIGEGGFGVVYAAEQLKPITRRVALKIIKIGMDTRAVVARFEQERQALAMMDHPNIAKVLDAGETQSGRPYFVMELVRGEPITRYCDRAQLSPRQRLDLFIPVCQAVQHAHQKGVIHRDIKPSNILVTLHDGVPVPKVIDFGIAKATSARLTDRTVYTDFHAFIGTPPYMAPEQAELSGLDIDTRADIYALGVLLYELLTGVTPFDARELMQAGLLEIQRILREVDPPKPSTRVSTLGETLATTAANRKTEPKRLGLLLRGDVDWMVMKALEKDRKRRYESASAFAEDVKRHLNGEPVVAAPPSAAYRMRKFVRRNQRLVAAGAIVSAAVILGSAGTTFGMIRAKTERARAEEFAAAARLSQAAALAAGYSGRSPGQELNNLRQALSIRETLLGAEHPDTALTKYRLAHLLLNLPQRDGQHEQEAESLLHSALAGLSAQRADAASELVDDILKLHLELCDQLDRKLDAVQIVRDMLTRSERLAPEDVETAQRLRLNLGYRLLSVGAFDEAAAVAARGSQVSMSHPTNNPEHDSWLCLRDTVSFSIPMEVDPKAQLYAYSIYGPCVATEPVVINLTEVEGPVVVALTSYDNVSWRLQPGPRTQLIACIASRSDVPVEGLPPDAQRLQSRWSVLPRPASPTDFACLKLVNRLKSLTGLTVSGVCAGHRDGAACQSWKPAECLPYAPPTPMDRAEVPRVSFFGPRYDRRHQASFVQEFDLTGPFGRVAPLPAGTHQAVYSADAQRLFAINGGRVGEITEGRFVSLPTDVPSAARAESSFLSGIAFDSKRNRIVAATYESDGAMYAYDMDTAAWSVLRSLENKDEVAWLAYDDVRDELVGLSWRFRDDSTLIRMAPDGCVRQRIELQGERNGWFEMVGHFTVQNGYGAIVVDSDVLHSDYGVEVDDKQSVILLVELDTGRTFPTALRWKDRESRPSRFP